MRHRYCLDLRATFTVRVINLQVIAGPGSSNFDRTFLGMVLDPVAVAEQSFQHTARAESNRWSY
jgi:hypothetical protein